MTALRRVAFTALFTGILCFPAAHAEIVPCSARYPRTQAFPIEPSYPDKEWHVALKAWNIRHQWGLKERASFPLRVHDGILLPTIEVAFPKGSANPSNDTLPRGGAGFYATAGFEPGMTAACLRYQVYFPADFDFVKGGKLPGLYGGDAPSGCKDEADLKGFSVRYMWRKKGAGTVYLYAPGKGERCGELVGLGRWHFFPGGWHTLEQEVILNAPGKADGVLRMWLNGWPVLDRREVTYRTADDIFIDGIMFSTFFGGDDASWASTKHQSLFFADFTAYFPRENKKESPISLE